MKISAIGFMHQDWLWPTIALALLLMAILLWKEWHVAKNWRFYTKLLALVLAVLSLCAIALKPTTLVEADNIQLVVLTEGYSQSTLDSLKVENALLKTIHYKVSEPLIDCHAPPTSVVVLGHGVQPFDLHQLEGYKTLFLSGHKIAGITQINLNNPTVGSNFEVKGEFRFPQPGSKLYLEGPGGETLDSVVFRTDSTKLFQFSAPAKAKGLFNYHLTEKDSLNVILSKSTVPVNIEERQALSILMLNAFPTFETKYLKNFLVENQHELVVRNQLSRGKFKYEYFNTPQSASAQISEKNLKNFDLVILDYSSLQWLSGNQKQLLENAVRREGLGIFVQPEVRYFNVKHNFNPFNFNRDNLTNTTVDKIEKGNFDKLPYQFGKTTLTEPIHTSNTKLISAYQRLELGRIGTTTINNSFYHVLSGNKSTYNRFWSELITTISKKQLQTTNWQSLTQLAFVDQPFEFKLRASTKQPGVISKEGTIPLKQDVNLPLVWYGTTYPKETGWQQLSLETDSTQIFNYYVFEAEDWKPLVAHNTHLENSRALNHNTISSNITRQQKPVNLRWFYLVFLLSMAWLWTEPKI